MKSRLLPAFMVVAFAAGLAADAFAAPQDKKSRRRPSTAERSSTGAEAPQLNPAQQANLRKLREDLAALGQGAKASEQEIRQLVADLQAASPQSPDPALVEALAHDLAAALEDGSLSAQETAQLTRAVYDVLNSAGLSRAEIEKLLDDVEAVLAASGVGRAEVQAVVDDLRAIYDEAQNAGSKAKRQRRRPG